MQENEREAQLMYFYFLLCFFSFRETDFIEYLLNIFWNASYSRNLISNNLNDIKVI